MKNKKLLFVLAIIVVLAAAMFACTPKTDNNYTLKFNTNGGSAVADLTIDKGSASFVFPTPPTKADKVFDDWYIDSALTTKATVTNVMEKFKSSSSVTLYAKWLNAEETNTIIFNSKGGDSVENKSVPKDASTFDFPASPTKASNVFEGWYLEETLDTAATVTNVLAYFSEHDTITLFAKWRAANEYTIHFNLNGGLLPNGVVQITFEETQAVPGFPTPTKDDNDFEGWFMDEAFETAATQALVAEALSGEQTSVTIHAKWELSAVGAAYAEAKDLFFSALLFAFDETRGKGIEPLDAAEQADLEDLKDSFYFGEDDDERQVYEDLRYRMDRQWLFSQWSEAMDLIKTDWTEDDENRFNEILQILKENVDTYRYYYEALEEINENIPCYLACQEILERIEDNPDDYEFQPGYFSLWNIVSNSPIFQSSGYGMVEDFARYYYSYFYPEIRPEELNDTYYYAFLLRKSYEYADCTAAKADFVELMSGTLAKLGSGDIVKDKLDALTALLGEDGDYDYSAFIVDQEDEYYYIEFKGLIGAIVELMRDEDIGLSTDDLGLFLHRMMTTLLDLSEEFPNKDEIAAELTENIILDYTDILFSFLELVYDNEIIDSIDKVTENLESISELSTMLSSIRSALKDFTDEYSAEELNATLGVVTSLLKSNLEYTIPVLSIITGTPDFHATLLMLHDVLQLFDMATLEVFITYDAEEGLVPAYNSYYYENIGILEAKILCRIYGDDYDADAFAEFYDDNEGALAYIMQFVLSSILGESQEGVPEDPDYDGDEGQGDDFMDGLLYYVALSLSAETLKEKFVIGSAQYDAIKAIALKDYAVAGAEEAPLSKEEIDRLIFVKTYFDFMNYAMLTDRIISILGIEDVEDGEIMNAAIALYAAKIDQHKLEAFADRLSVAPEGGSDIITHIKTIVNAIFDGDDGFTAEELAATITRLIKLAPEYMLGLPGASPELLAALDAVLNDDAAHIDSSLFMLLKLIELTAAIDPTEEYDTYGLIICGLTSLKDYYADKDKPDVAVFALYTLASALFDAFAEGEIDLAVELRTFVELLFSDQYYGDFDSAIDLLIVIAEEQAAVASQEDLEDNEEYYMTHNIIKTIYRVFGDNPEEDFADIVALGGEDTLFAQIIGIIFDNYDLIAEWAAEDYDLETFGNAPEGIFDEVITPISDIIKELFPEGDDDPEYN